jgi:hypothetical protein
MAMEFLDFPEVELFGEALASRQSWTSQPDRGLRSLAEFAPHLAPSALSWSTEALSIRCMVPIPWKRGLFHREELSTLDGKEMKSLHHLFRPIAM